jgi:hypothetical protein
VERMLAWQQITDIYQRKAGIRKSLKATIH